MRCRAVVVVVVVVAAANKLNSLFNPSVPFTLFNIQLIHNFEPVVRYLSKIKCQPHLLNLLSDIKSNNSITKVE